MVIGEIIIRLGSRPINYYSNNFLKELIRAESLAKFKQYILYELNFLAEHERIYVPRIDPEKFNLRQQEIAEAFGAAIRAD